MRVGEMRGSGTMDDVEGCIVWRLKMVEYTAGG